MIPLSGQQGQPQPRASDISLGMGMGQGQTGTSARRSGSRSGLARGTGGRHSAGIAERRHGDRDGTRLIGDFSLWTRDRPSVLLGK